MALRHLFYLFILFIHPLVLNSQEKKDIPTQSKVTLSTGIGGAMLQISQVELGAIKYKSIPRFSYFFNTGVDINFHILKQVVPFTGFQLRNIGIILKPTDSIKTKERVYTLGAPLGIKYFLKDKKSYIALGADIGLAFNYKYKLFYNGKKSYKENEFFSDKASLMQSSVFTGMSWKGTSIYLNYYLNNFYSSSLSAKKARLFVVSLNFDIDKNSFNTKVKSKK